MEYGRVLAADPGLTTGFALWYPGCDVPQAGQIEGLEVFLSQVMLWLELKPETPALIIAERFIITPETAKKSQAPWSLEVSGGLRFLCHRYGAEYAQQTPAEAKRLIHDDRLKALGWYKPGKVHANDALRHLAYGLAKRRAIRLPATGGK